MLARARDIPAVPFVGSDPYMVGPSVSVMPGDEANGIGSELTASTFVTVFAGFSLAGFGGTGIGAAGLSTRRFVVS
jgi:hypothetical protein